MLKEIQIENRMGAYLGYPERGGKRPAVIHLHERYGIVQHTSDLGQKLVDAGYVVLVPDLFSRFTGDRQALNTRPMGLYVEEACIFRVVQRSRARNANLWPSTKDVGALLRSRARSLRGLLLDLQYVTLSPRA